MLMHHSAQFIVDSEYAAYDKTIQITHVIPLYDGTPCTPQFQTLLLELIINAAVPPRHINVSYFGTILPTKPTPPE